MRFFTCQIQHFSVILHALSQEEWCKMAVNNIETAALNVHVQNYACKENWKSTAGV